MSRKRTFAAGTVLLLASGLLLVSASAQRQYQIRELLWLHVTTNRRAPQGVEFIFARAWFSTHRTARGFRGILYEGWAHDYPVAEEHILQVASEATSINLNTESYVIVRLESEEIFRYPFLYFSEVGEMNLNEREVANLREYLNRGGFAMVDDFDNQVLLDWFAGQMLKVFPDRPLVELTVDHPIFHTFYEIPTLAVDPPAKGRRNRGERARFYGYFDDLGRLCMIINHNNDLGDFWEWIDQPRYPLEPSTVALRFGINYLLFSLSH